MLKTSSKHSISRVADIQHLCVENTFPTKIQRCSKHPKSCVAGIQHLCIEYNVSTKIQTLNFNLNLKDAQNIQYVLQVFNTSARRGGLW